MQEQNYKQQVRINLRPDSLYKAKLMSERTKQSLSQTIEQAINNTFKGTTEEQMNDGLPGFLASVPAEK